VAFGKSFDAFEVQLKRMIGAYFWCSPLRNGRLDLRALGL
jgi:porphyrinogen peroxidase